MKGKLVFLKSLLMSCAVLLCINVASADPWVSSPSAVLQGDDIEVQGGGAPGSTKVLVTLHDSKTGKKISESVVYTRSNGDFSTSFPAVNSNVEVRVALSGKSIMSKTTTSILQ